LAPARAVLPGVRVVDLRGEELEEAYAGTITGDRD
jgi:hypothetical protein